MSNELKREIQTQLREAKDLLAEAERLDSETEPLAEAGYFDADGNPRKDEAGKKIWDEAQRQLERESAAPRNQPIQ